MVGLGTWTQHARGEVEEAIKTAIRWSEGGVQAPRGLPTPPCRPWTPPQLPHRRPASQHNLPRTHPIRTNADLQL